MVYNSMTDQIRECVLVPSIFTDADGNAFGRAGVSVRPAPCSHASELCWKIGTISPDSPAQKAGFIENTDFIVGSPRVLFREENDLFKYLKLSEDKDIQLFVWNSDSKTLRIVNLHPCKWSDDAGIVGCDIFFGVIHRIPLYPGLSSFPFVLQKLPTATPETTDNTVEQQDDDDRPEILKPNAVFKFPNIDRDPSP